MPAPVPKGNDDRAPLDDEEPLGPAGIEPSELVDELEAWTDEPDASGDPVELDGLLPELATDGSVEDGDAVVDTGLALDLTLAPPPEPVIEEASEAALDVGPLTEDDDDADGSDDGSEGPIETLLLDATFPDLGSHELDEWTSSEAPMGTELHVARPITLHAPERLRSLQVVAEGSWNCLALAHAPPATVPHRLVWLAGTELAVLTPIGVQKVATLPHRAGAIVGVAEQTADSKARSMLVLASRVGPLSCAVFDSAEPLAFPLELRAVSGLARATTQARLASSERCTRVFVPGQGLFRLEPATCAVLPLTGAEDVVDIAQGDSAHSVIRSADGYSIRDDNRGEVVMAPGTVPTGEWVLVGRGAAFCAYSESGEVLARAAHGSVLHTSLEQAVLAATFCSGDVCLLAVRNPSGYLCLIRLPLDGAPAQTVLESEHSVGPDDDCQMVHDETSDTLYLLLAGRLLSLAPVR